jgi:hypothetical protein
VIEMVAELEGRAEHLPPGRESALVRSKLQEARLAEFERLRKTVGGDVDLMREVLGIVEQALDRGRAEGIEMVLRR